ncbi:ABC transporter permease [Dethiobacter alkaliphilus]|uniref:Binding-protein-dependent transport systems inner membrane component n=1 Tax=Dethiobacter alkaliphilus AHT 1 TaxID=555088 RepID=C0GHX3_DETAL|nr:ABC transporter permease [Dethiobacter alkaliphilus]EEG77047.1 binding-protein-dependent transport systems inner membrane component [Dethiobacter alkaliphilus AHT 1]
MTGMPSLQNSQLHTPTGYSGSFWPAFRANRPAVISAVLLLLITFAAALAPLLATHDPYLIRLSSDAIKLSPSAQHLLGTDHLGRDLWSRMLYGARISLLVGFLTMLISVAVGTVYGAASGYYGGRLDFWMMRLVDILLSLPTILLVMIMAGIVKPNVFGIAAIIGLASWMRVARLVRGQFLSLKEQGFVEAARALGYSDYRIIFVHILPNVSSVIIVNATLLVAYAILTESALSFLGLGLQAPMFSWGSMLNAAQDIVLLRQVPWLAFFPGLAIFVTVLCFNFCGDGLRDALEPKTITCSTRNAGKR